MLKTHVHEILEMINGKTYSIVELQEEVISHFSKDMLFHSCSIESMSAVQAVEFLVERGKFLPQQPETSCCGGCGG
jgi:probable metal-binding protein